MLKLKKGKAWHFGMKAHISVDAHSGLIHTVGITTAKDHDISVMGGVIRENDQAVFDDKGYYSDQIKRAARKAGVYWAVLDKAKRNRKLSASQRKLNKKQASIRAKVEPIFRIIKCQFGYRKTRYRGLAKNAAGVFADRLGEPVPSPRSFTGGCRITAPVNNPKSGKILVWGEIKRK